MIKSNRVVNKNKHKQAKLPPDSGKNKAGSYFRFVTMSPGQMKTTFIFLIVVILFLCYRYSIYNQFVNWDDFSYVQNQYIRSFSAFNLKMMLFHKITIAYFHPLTMLSLAVNHHFSGDSPMGYYITNIVIHIINTVLVFLLVFMLLAEMGNAGYGTIQGKLWLAAFAALCFGIHPMHVEAVSWISERKGVLYGFFYYVSLITYLKYIRTGKLTWYFLVLLLFLCSLLSKPLAVVLPFSLLCFDVLLKRDIKVSMRKIVIEKVPFFILSLGSGLWAWFAQREAGVIAKAGVFTLWERIMFPSYAFIMYIYKAFVPLHLSTYYPYPDSTAPGGIPFIFYLAPFLAAGLIIMPVYLAYKSGNNALRVIVSGLGFYIINVLFILQIVSFGAVIMSDRYTYIAYFGIFFIILYLASVLMSRYPSSAWSLCTAGALFLLFLVINCYNRTKVWHNSETLWTDVVEQYPTAQYPLMNLGDYFAEIGDTEKAFQQYYTLVNLHTTLPTVYKNIGDIYAMRRDFKNSLQSYNVALQYDSTLYVTYLDRAVTYINMNRPDLALKDLNMAYRNNPGDGHILLNRAIAYSMTGNYSKAIEDISKLIEQEPANPAYYLKRGTFEYSYGKMNEALTDYLESLKLNPLNGECMYDISVIYHILNKDSEALKYAFEARQSGYNIPQGFINLLSSK